MFLLAKLIIITSILVLGYTASSQEGMILYPIRKWAETKKSKIYEPLFLCHWCAPSIYSVLGYFFIWIIGNFSSFTWNEVAIYPLVVCGSSMVNGLVWATYKCIAAIDQNYQYENAWIEQDQKKASEPKVEPIVITPAQMNGNAKTITKKKPVKKVNGKSK